METLLAIAGSPGVLIALGWLIVEARAVRADVLTIHTRVVELERHTGLTHKAA